ncbi:unnamed protein product [Phytophthora fragariaefolia]|uniref:Unnamed protein product n=1 Tax=Phytophthora fragariaefolia TaxID=1490495 RepID=A0A9W7D2U4_9STRA|nr:unnamed protein product [Phytophthora fragariaefolia]
MCNAKRPWETPDDEGDGDACDDKDDDFEPDSSSEVSGDDVDDTCEAKTFFGLSSSEDETHDAIPKSAHAEVPEDAQPCIPESRDEIHGSSDDTVDCCGGFLRGFPSRWLSWERFHSEVKEYSARTKQCFILRSSQTVTKRNQQMRSADRYFPLEWKHYCKTLRCTHGVKQKSRGDGIRQHQYVRFTGCKAKINATLLRIGDKYYVYVRSSGTHNHAVRSELWDYYVENRKIRDPALLSSVSDMRAAGSSTKGILAWLRKRQELKHAGKGNTSDVERTESVLQEFTSEADGNTARVFVDTSRDVSVAVVFQTAGMKRLFSAFPEVVMVDTTHDTNANAYKLFSFVVHDCFGKGQYVHHALVERETKENLRLVVNAFLMNNPMHRRVKVLMTDKAFHEKDVLAELFPQARQLLCQFHVQQWFAKQVTRLVKGTSAEKAVVEASMSALIDAKSEEEYKNQRALFLDLLGGNKKHPLFITFIKTWDNIQADWVAHRRGNIPHFRNNTKNRLESKWGKIKQLLTSAYSIDELVSSLIMLQE